MEFLAVSSIGLASVALVEWILYQAKYPYEKHSPLRRFRNYLTGQPTVKPAGYDEFLEKKTERLTQEDYNSINWNIIWLYEIKYMTRKMKMDGIHTLFLEKRLDPDIQEELENNGITILYQ